jgi:hypothetical protein
MRNKKYTLLIITDKYLKKINSLRRLGCHHFSTFLENTSATCPGAHPAPYTMGTGSFPGVKRPGRSVDHPPPSSTEVKEREKLYIYSPSGPSCPVLW